jgi:hypothetical protein
MIKRNIGIVAIIVLLFVAFLNYDDGNKNKRSSIYKQALSIQDDLREGEELLDRIYHLKARLDLVIKNLSSLKEMNKEEQEIYNTAMQYRDEVSARLEIIESKGKKVIDEYNDLVEEYNRITKPILLGKRELPAKMVKYEKPNLPYSPEQKSQAAD